MYTLVIGLIVFTSILLILVVLAQKSKGGGLTSQFGGSGASNLIGVKKTGDLLEKLTWSFVIIIMALTLSTSFIAPGSTGNTEQILDETNEQVTPDFNLGADGDSSLYIPPLPGADSSGN